MTGEVISTPNEQQGRLRGPASLGLNRKALCNPAEPTRGARYSDVPSVVPVEDDLIDVANMAMAPARNTLGIFTDDPSNNNLANRRMLRASFRSAFWIAARSLAQTELTCQKAASALRSGRATKHESQAHR